jgi:hypothetical protein
VSRALLFSAVFAAACGGQPMVAYSPAEKSTELRPEKLYAAAEERCRSGYLIAKRDPEGFASRPKSGRCSARRSKGQVRHVWIVETANGTLKLRLECQFESGDEQESCGTERPEKLVKEQDKLVEQIVAEASGD